MKSLEFPINTNHGLAEEQDEYFRAYYLKKFAKGNHPKYVLHRHKAVEIYFMHEGECEFTVCGESITLRSGDVIFIPPEIMHMATYDEEKPCSHFVVFCNKSLLGKEASELFESSFCAESIPKSIGNAEEIFRKLRWEYKNSDGYSYSMIKNLLSTLTVTLLRSKRSAGTAKPQSLFVRTTVSYIKENYASQITLEDAAKKAAVSLTYLSRTFKKEMGCGFKEYLINYRLTQSEAMLLEYPDRTILEVAYECGFNDSNYFSASFKKLYGVTPSEFRAGNMGGGV